MSFLAKDGLYTTEKPYRISYKSENVPNDNHVREVVDKVPIHDLRDYEHELSFEKNGISVLDVDIDMEYNEFSDVTKIENQYCDNMGRVLLDYMGAKEVQIFDFNVRPTQPSGQHHMRLKYTARRGTTSYLDLINIDPL